MTGMTGMTGATGVSLGNLLYFIKANNADFKQKSAETGDALQDIGKKFSENKKTVLSWGKEITASIQKVSDFVKRNKEGIQTVAVGGGAALAGLVLEMRKATKENVTFKNSLIGLSSIAKSFKKDVDQTTRAAKDLSADGLMGVSDAATGLKNLLQAGFGLDQAIILMERFKDSAAFGRQGALSFGEAIRTATEGVKNGNSILADNAGVTKNLSVMLKEAGYSAQDLMRAADDTGVRMAIFNGIVNETRHQVGDAAKLADELGGALSRTEESTQKVHRAIGAAIEKALRELLNIIQPILERTADWIERNKEFVGTVLTIATAVAALTTSGAAWLLLIPRISSALTLFTGGPVGWAIVGLTALVTVFVTVKNAMQNAREENQRLADSYQKQTDEVDALVEEYQNLSEKTNKTAEEKKRMVDLSNQIAQILPQAARGYDEEGNAILDLNSALREMVLLKGKELEMRSKDLEQHIRDEEKKLRKKEKQRADLEAEWTRLQQRWETWGQYPEQERLNELTEEYNRQLRGITAEIDEANQSLTNYRQQLEDISNMLSGVTPEWMRQERKGRQAEETTTGGETGDLVSAFDSKELLDELKTELESIDKVAAAFGDTSDVAKDKASALRAAIIALVRNSIDPTNTAMGDLVEQYKKYTQTAEDAKKETYDLSENETKLRKALEDVDKQAAVFGDTIDADAEKLKLYQDAIISALVNDVPIENIQDLINEYNTLTETINNTAEALKRQQESTHLINTAQAELDNWRNRELSSLELLARQLERRAALDEENKDKLLAMADATRKLAEEQEKATTAEENQKAASSLLAQAQEELAQMTGKALPSWEQFALRLEKIADADGVLPKTAEKLKELAQAIRDVGSTEESITVFGMTFTATMIKAFETAKKVMSEWHNFTITIITRIQSIYSQMYKNRGIEMDNWYKREKDAIKNSEKNEKEKKAAFEALDEEYDQKKREMMRRQAAAEKDSAIFNIIINTARAAIEALPNIVLSGIVSALGMVQLAYVSAQPLPELAGGGLLIDDTIFRGGEGDYHEAVLPLSDSVFARLAEGIVRKLSEMRAPALQPAMDAPSGLIVPEAQIVYENNLNLHVGTLIGNKEGYRQLAREIYPYTQAEKKRRGG